MDDLSHVDACLLVGGLGTRLRSVVPDRPKPLAVVAGRAFLSHVLDQLVAAGVRRAILCTGYRGEMIEASFGREYGPLKLEYSHEEAPLGTGGALLAALPMVKTETILAANGDSLCPADLRDLARFHS